MLALLGILGVLTALTGSVLLAWRAARAASRSETPPLMREVGLVLTGAVLAMLALETALLGDDFSLEYAANHHARATPFPFNLATAWAALEGSIVLWALVLAVYTYLVWRSYRRSPDRMGVGALSVMGAVGVFFFALMVTVANPFRVCVEAGPNSCLAASPWPWVAPQAPADGPGPNPLLQNHLLMAIHPPLLYLGYVGLTVPFAHAMASLALGNPGTEWLRRTRRATLVAWTFLTLGIVFGGWWAYEVLSWGGYWAWDPVENASFMPWLIATAFLHSALVQGKRGALPAWNLVLVIGAFALTILGTFLTRSGTVASVHSFTQSAIGPVLLGFLVLVLAGSFSLLATRAHLVADAPRLESLFSREGGFLLNNLILSVFAFVVVAGTLFPMLVEAFSGDRVAVGPPFFNRLAVPLSFGLLLAMGVGPVTPWRRGDPAVVWRRIHRPLQVALLAGAGTVLAASRIGYVVLGVVAGTFVVAVIVSHLFEQAGRVASARGTGLRSALLRVLRADPGFWAGQLAHVGIALVAVALSFTANLADRAQVRLSPGESISFAGYELTYRSPFLQTLPSRRVEGATIEVGRGGRLITELEPKASFFAADTAGITSPAVHSTLAGDLYLTLLDIDSIGITLRLDTSPLIWMLWVGGLTTAGGGIWAVTARRHQPDREMVYA
jgi:cytochrome c-type biogenesis protein CcmF